VTDRIKILTARRAYEFEPDNLRLTVLIAAGLNQQIQQRFRFQAAQVATPAPMFGPVPITLPPGVVFDYGATQTPEGLFAPIRFMHFEPNRIVFDVAGPSSAIDWTYEQIRGMWAELLAPDGSPAVGEPERVVDYSEITARFEFGLEKLVSEPLRALAQQTFATDGRKQKVVPVSIRFQAASPSDQILPGEIGAGGLSRGQMIDVRAGTNLEDGVYFSATNLPTDQHLVWLEALDQHLKES
jgi:hypothetical protein